MSSYDARGVFAIGKEMVRRRNRAASRDSDAVIRKNARVACGRINQWFLKCIRKPG